jgi:hypothetical protein
VVVGVELALQEKTAPHEICVPASAVLLKIPSGPPLTGMARVGTLLIGLTVHGTTEPPPTGATEQPPQLKLRLAVLAAPFTLPPKSAEVQLTVLPPDTSVEGTHSVPEIEPL